MSRIHLKNGPVIDPAKIDCSPNAKRFLEYACQLASFDGDINTVGMRFVHALDGIISGVAGGEMLPKDLLDNRMEILHCLPEALEAFERTYPGVPLRMHWAYWLESATALHKACLLDKEKYSTVARVAVAWWDSRLIRPAARRIVCPCDLENVLAHFYERREEIDGVYERMFSGIADRIEQVIGNKEAISIHSTLGWMETLERTADDELFNLGEGGGGIWYLTEEMMKVTPTRVLVTGYDCEWIEVYPGDRLREEVTDRKILMACARHSYGRFVDHAEWSKND